MSKTVAIILGGGQGTRMDILCRVRSKLALPFAGKFKVVDFSLSNCLNSNIENIGVLVNYQRDSLSEYLRGWSAANMRSKPLSLLKPKNGSYKGTADAILQNQDYLETHKPKAILVLAGDHIYRMDYRPLLSFHEKTKSDVTIGVIPVLQEQARRFGIVTVGNDFRITDFVEKPEFPSGNLASMGIYIFNREIIHRFLIEDSLKDDSPHDIGYAVIPEMLRQNIKISAYKFDSYWEDIGTMEAYYWANMNLIGEYPSLSLNGKWPILTRNHHTGLARIFTQDNVTNSIISQGCDIRGNVSNSILSPGIVVEEHATIKNSIVMENTIVGEHSTVENCILDESTKVGNFCYVGFPSRITPNPGITVWGKGATVPSYTAICQNSRMSSCVDTIDIFKNTFPADSVVSYR
jgi:glucose-1-phosphate adenylyltransferase